MKRKHTKHKHFYLYHNEIFDSELLICIGLRADRIVKRLPKYISKKAVEIFKDKDNIDFLESEITQNHITGIFVRFKKDGISYFFMWLREFKNNWECLDWLNHEIVHYRQMLFEEKKIEGEPEFEAYFQQSVFRSLRKLLNEWK